MTRKDSWIQDFKEWGHVCMSPRTEAACRIVAKELGIPPGKVVEALGISRLVAKRRKDLRIRAEEERAEP